MKISITINKLQRQISSLNPEIHYLQNTSSLIPQTPIVTCHVPQVSQAILNKTQYSTV